MLDDKVLDNDSTNPEGDSTEGDNTPSNDDPNNGVSNDNVDNNDQTDNEPSDSPEGDDTPSNDADDIDPAVKKAREHAAGLRNKLSERGQVLAEKDKRIAELEAQVATHGTRATGDDTDYYIPADAGFFENLSSDPDNIQVALAQNHHNNKLLRDALLQSRREQQELAQSSSNQSEISELVADGLTQDEAEDYVACIEDGSPESNRAARRIYADAVGRAKSQTRDSRRKQQLQDRDSVDYTGSSNGSGNNTPTKSLQSEIERIKKLPFDDQMNELEKIPEEQQEAFFDAYGKS